MTPSDFHAEQRRVAMSMAAAIVLTLLMLGCFWTANPFAVPHFANSADRLVYALSLSPFVLIWLVVAVGNVARLRFFSPADIAGSARGKGDGEGVRQANAILRNTLEQVVLALGAQAAFAASVPPSGSGALPGLVVLFCIGRLFFWVGYRSGAAGRAFGFALSFYPSVAACLIALFLSAR